MVIGKTHIYKKCFFSGRTTKRGAVGGGAKPPEPLRKKNTFLYQPKKNDQNLMKHYALVWGGYPDLSGPTTEEKKIMCAFLLFLCLRCK